MNKNILKKCIAKLSEKDPDIKYVLGMLETLYEMQIGVIEAQSKPIMHTEHIANINIPKDEGGVLDEIAKARLAGIKDVALPE